MKNLIIKSLDSKRVLFSAPPRYYYVINVGVVVTNPAVLPSFSGKVVKSLLIKSNPLLEKIFRESIGGRPKPIHVSPLGYRGEKGKLVFLWKRSDAKNKVLEASPDIEYFFTVSCTEEIFEMVLEAVMSMNNVKLFNTEWIITEIDAKRYKLPDKNPIIRLEDAVAIKVMFRSPIQPIDPYRKSQYKRLNILPGILFSYNAGEITRMYRRGPDYWRVLDILNYVLIESKTYWKTVKQVNIIYDNKEIPALTGYVKYWVNLENTTEEEKLLVENILSHAQIIGAGSSRSIGLGHIEIKIEHRGKYQSKPTKTPLDTHNNHKTHSS